MGAGSVLGGIAGAGAGLGVVVGAVEGGGRMEGRGGCGIEFGWSWISEMI